MEVNDLIPFGEYLRKQGYACLIRPGTIRILTATNSRISGALRDVLVWYGIGGELTINPEAKSLLEDFLRCKCP